MHGSSTAAVKDSTYSLRAAIYEPNWPEVLGAFSKRQEADRAGAEARIVIVGVVRQFGSFEAHPAPLPLPAWWRVERNRLHW